VWKGIVSFLLFFAVSGYRYLGDGGADRGEILHDGTCVSRMCLLPFGAVSPGILKIHKFGHLKRISRKRQVGALRVN